MIGATEPSADRVDEPLLNARAQQALDLLQHGRPAEAEALLRGILELQPRHFHALHLLGIAALERRDARAAVTFLQAAVTVNTDVAAAHSNLAVALRSLQRPAEALCAYDAALKLDADLAAAQSGRGHALFDLRRFEEALAAFERVLARHPASEFAWNDLARTVLRLRRPQQALAAAAQALARNPACIEALVTRGSALRELQQPEAALASYQAALRLDPRRAEVHGNLANLWLHLGRAQPALEACDRALALDPSLVETRDVRAQALRSLGRLQESLLAQQQLLAIDPQHPHALGKYLHAKAAVCDWSQQHELLARVDAGVGAGEPVCTPMIYLSLSASPHAQWRCARSYAAAALPPRQALAAAAPYRHGRTRLAYLSADFRDHPVAHLLAGVLECHDRQAFEVHAIATDHERRAEPQRTRIVKAVECFHDVAERSDAAVAKLLRELEIDILIDLGGHTRGSRLGILAHRPAPIQVSFLGFMGTTGVDFIDYVIGDAVALPARLQPFFSERIVQLPHCFLPNDDVQPIAEPSWSRADVGLPSAGFVFCAFNSPHKLNAAMFEVWLRLLRRVPGSVLWLKDGDAALRENLRAQATLRQVDGARLVFAPSLASMPHHLARYRLADLFLDTLPYGAHATARDALWAGLPVLTCVGEAFASRVAASLLHGLGLEELAAPDLETYTARAVALAESPPALAALRAKLAVRRSTAPVFSTGRYCRDLEAAFAAMAAASTRLESGPMNSR